MSRESPSDSIPRDHWSRRYIKGMQLILRKGMAEQTIPPSDPPIRWFKAKTYGWGWTPSAWQGWVVMLIYAGAIAVSAFVFLFPKPTTAGWIGYFSAIAVATALLIFVCYKTGEKPGWRWGN
jgi:hypothetical protein